MAAFQNGERQPIGNVLLAGATGFLGVHIFKELIDNYDGQIFCLVRAKGGVAPEDRLKRLLLYYFGDSMDGLFGSRVHIVEGDATEPIPDNQIIGLSDDLIISTVINCAASVKHFAKGDEIEQVNVGAVRNLVAWCIRHDVRLVHVSTGSVLGAYLAPDMPDGFSFDEHALYVGQCIDDNQYVHSKFMAERFIYDAMLHHGLNAKVLRAGNLAPRLSDGRFQINAASNNFMSSLKAYRYLGVIPYEMMDSITELSPIDCVARAMLLLATTPKECVCFMPSNQYHMHLGDIVMQYGDVRMVEMAEFQQAVSQAMTDPDAIEVMRPFMAYASNGPSNRPVGPRNLDVSHTVQVLYRLGFRWPVTDGDYVRRFLKKS